MRDWIRRNPFASFYVLAIAFPTLLFTYMVLMEVLLPNAFGPGISVYKQFNLNMAQLQQSAPLLTQHRDGVLVYLTLYAMLPAASPFLFFPFAPTVSAVIVTAIARGGKVVRALLGCYAPLRGNLGWRYGIRLYGLLLLCILGCISLVVLSEALFNHGERLGTMVKVWGLNSSPLFLAGWLAALFTNQGGLLEELGWRGYAWPVLMRKVGTPLVAAAVLGTAWALWHFPREIPSMLSGQLSLRGLLVEETFFIVSCISMTIVAVTFVNFSGGSVWPAIMVHGTLNFLYLCFETGRTGVRSNFNIDPVIVWVIAALLVLVFVGPDLGWKKRLQIHGGDGSTDPSNLWAGAAAGK